MSVICTKCGADISFESEYHPNCEIVERLKAENAELLDALIFMLAQWEEAIDQQPEYMPIANKARAAIAKATNA